MSVCALGRWRSWVREMLLVGALGALIGCGGASPRPDVILVTIDTLRADRLGVYGNPNGLTPALDALAERGVRFSDASAAVPVTLPSHATMMTGRYPSSTGVRNNGTFVLPDDERTLAELLSEAGWATAAVVASYPLDERYGLGQGFELYDDEFPRLGGDGAEVAFFPERPADRVTDSAIRAWEALGDDRPRFLWVHYFDPHAPYAPPAPWAEKYADARYDGEVAFVDAEIGRLLESIDPNGRSIVIATSDHGEGLDEHDEKTHGVFLYQSTMQVPLLVVAPRVWPKRHVVDVPVSLADLAPTLLALLGLVPPDGLDGIDLGVAVLDDGPLDRPVYGESFVPKFDYRFSELRMVRSADLKYIDAPVPELYDIAQDPGELRNLAGGHPDEADLRERLDDLVRSEDPDAAQRASSALDAEAIASLRSLGYVAAGGAGRSTDDTRGRDPKSMTGWIRRYDRALGHLSSGRVDDGIGLLRELEREAPENWLVPFQIAGGQLAAGRLTEAEASLVDVVARAPEFSHAYLLLADVRGRLGDYDQAERDYRAAAATLPWSGEPWYLLGEMQAVAGRFDRAGEAFVEAVLREPSSAEFTRALADLHLERGAPDRCVEVFERLRTEAPGEPEILAALARAYRALGEVETARRIAIEALDIDPTRSSTRIELGEISIGEDDPFEAERHFRAAVASTPDDLRARYGLARSLVSQQRPREAEDELARLLSSSPGFAPAFVLRGRMAEDAGDRAGAARLYRRALELDPGSTGAWDGLNRLRARPGER